MRKETRAVLGAMFLLVLTASMARAGSRTRQDAIDYFLLHFPPPPDVVVLAPQSSVGSGDAVDFVMESLAVPVSIPGWMVYVDLDPDSRFQHATEVYLVPVDDQNGNVAVHAGDSWISVNGTQLYADISAAIGSADYVTGTVPASPPPPPPGISPRLTVPDPTICGLLVEGSSEAIDKAEAADLMAALPDVGTWTKLGVDDATPTLQDICDTIEGLDISGCTKFYFVFGGHGGFNSGMFLDNASREFLTGTSIACKIVDKFPNTVEICFVISACFSEQVLTDACQKFMDNGFTASGIAATCHDKTAKASIFPGMPAMDFVQFARFLRECVENPIAGKTLKECVDLKLAAAQQNANKKPLCYPAKTRATVPQEMKEQDWTPGAECYLVLGSGRATLNLTPEDVLQVEVGALLPVTLETVPTFVIPEDPELTGLKLYAQVLMHNAASSDSIKCSQGLEITLGDAALPASYGSDSGILLFARQPALLGGELDLGFKIKGTYR